MYKHGDRYQVVSDQVVGLPHGTIVTIEGDQPDNDTLIRTRRAGSSAFFVLFADDIQLAPADEPTDFPTAVKRSSDLLASVQTEENDATIIEQKFVDAMIGIQAFFDARPEVRSSFGGGSKVDKNLIAYAARLEEENRALQAANRRLQDKLADEVRLHGEQSEKIARLEEENRVLQANKKHVADIFDQMAAEFIEQQNKLTDCDGIMTHNTQPNDVLTFWNGQPCQARRIIAVVAKAEKPTYWYAGLEGTEREVIEISDANQAGPQPFYIDNDRLKDEDTDPDGQNRSGWRKVTKGHGMMNYPHRSIRIERIVREVQS